jgi:hypothetical protein
MPDITDAKIEKSVEAFRAMLERLLTEPGVEANVPYLEITAIISLATGKPTSITVTETLWPGSDDFRAIWKDNASQA